MFVTYAQRYGDYEGLGFFKKLRIGKFFKNIGISAIRVGTLGAYDPKKNRFFAPFSSGSVRNLAKGLTGASTMGLVNADKFFDSRTMRTVGTVVGAVGAGVATVATAGALAPAAFGAIGGVASSVGGAIMTGAKVLGAGIGLFQTGSRIFGRSGGGGGGGGGQVVVQQIPQTGYPTVVSPLESAPGTYSGGVPYQYNPVTGVAAYQYDGSGNVQRVFNGYIPSGQYDTGFGPELNIAQGVPLNVPPGMSPSELVGEPGSSGIPTWVYVGGGTLLLYLMLKK